MAKLINHALNSRYNVIAPYKTMSIASLYSEIDLYDLLDTVISVRFHANILVQLYEIII